MLQRGSKMAAPSCASELWSRLLCFACFSQSVLAIFLSSIIFLLLSFWFWLFSLSISLLCYCYSVDFFYLVVVSFAVVVVTMSVVAVFIVDVVLVVDAAFVAACIFCCRCFFLLSFLFLLLFAFYCFSCRPNIDIQAPYRLSFLLSTYRESLRGAPSSTNRRSCFVVTPRA